MPNETTPEVMVARAQKVFAMVQARLQIQGRHLGDMSPEDIEREVDEAAATLKFAEDHQKRASQTIVALLRAEDPDTRWTGQDGLFQRAAAEIERLMAVLGEVAELIEVYADADHNGNSFTPNNAMCARQVIAEALGDFR